MLAEAYALLVDADAKEEQVVAHKEIAERLVVYNALNSFKTVTKM